MSEQKMYVQEAQSWGSEDYCKQLYKLHQPISTKMT